MGTLFSALDIGRSGLQAAQVQLDVSGHNIANVNRQGFSRQRVELLTREPNLRPYGAVGRGVFIGGIQRLRDQFLDIAFRQEVATRGATGTAATYFARIEDIFNEPGDNGLSLRINQFFNALQDFAGTPDNLPARVAALSEGAALSATFNEIDRRLNLLRSNANNQVRDTVTQINSLGERIAELNTSIQRLEASGREANDLRDDRDVLLDELAELVNISFRERDNGIVDVLVGGDQFITGRTVRLLETVPNPAIDPSRPDLLEVRFADNSIPVYIRDGSLRGLLDIRDTHIAGLEADMDGLARTFIQTINTIHSSGNGLANFDAALTTQNPVTSLTAPLNSAGLPFSVTNGSFDVLVYDNTGSLVETITINITTTGLPLLQTSLNTVRLLLNVSPNLIATSNPQGQMILSPEPNRSFVFANDTSGFLAAVGLNTLFNGSDAGTIAVNPDLAARPEWLASSDSADPLDTGNNAIALLMAQLRNEPIFSGNSQTINQFYESVLVSLGVDARANAELLTIQQNAVEDFQTRRQEVSGVNIDEEVTQLLQFQRAFEASARVITTADRMLDALLGIVS